MLGLSILKLKVIIIKNNNNELSWSLKDFDGVKLQRIHKK